MLKSSSIANEALYAQLKELAATEPAFDGTTPEVARWLGRLHDAVSQAGVGTDAISLTVASDGLFGMLHDRNMLTIRNVMYRALARVERSLPEVAQGGFIAAGDVFEALAVMANAVGAAKHRLLFVDPYLAPEVLLKYAIMAPEGVAIDLLGGGGKIKPGLAPAANEWIQQYGASRPLRVRQVDARLLHDRLLIADDSTAWDISQSLNALAARSHATIAKAPADQAAMKVEAYAALFEDGTSAI